MIDPLCMFNIKTHFINKLHVLIILQIIELIALIFEWLLDYTYLKLSHKIYNFVCFMRLIYVFNKFIFKITDCVRFIYVFKIMRIRILILSFIYIVCYVLSFMYTYFSYASIIVMIIFYVTHKKELKLLYHIIENRQIVKMCVIYVILLIIASVFE